MMIALLHFPYRNATPDGIWWFDGSPTLKSYYPANKALETVGGTTLRAVHFSADEHDMSEVFARLAERPPYPDDWETVTLTGASAKEYLDLARKSASKAPAKPKAA